MTRPLIVLKIGGASTAAAALLVAARSVEAGVCVVHGGGPQITALMRERAVEPRFLDGRRITDEPTLACVEAGLRIVSDELCGALARRQVPCAAFADGLVIAQPVAGLGRVGIPLDAVVSPLEDALRDGRVPVVSPLGRSPEGLLLNVNADDAAAEIAARLHADELCFVTDVEGVLDGQGAVLAVISVSTPPASASGGMLPKLAACARALRGGVSAVRIGATEVTA